MSHVLSPCVYGLQQYGHLNNSYVHLFGKELFIRITVRVFHDRVSICVGASFPIGFEGGVWVGWLVVFGLNDPLRQYFSLYRVVSQREGERAEKG